MDRRHLIGAGAVLPFVSFPPAVAADADSFAVDGHIALKAYKGLVEEHLGGILRALRALATTSDVRSGDWPLISPPLQEFARDFASAAAVWYARADGSYYTADGGPSGESLRDREYFPRLLAGDDVDGTLAISRSTGHRSIIVATPVRGGEPIVGALGVSVRARLLSQLVEQRTGLPDDLLFYAIDGKGQTAIHKDPEKMFAFPSDMGDDSLKAAVQKMLSSPRGSVSYRFQGVPRVALFEKSELTGWRFVLAKIVG